MDERFLLEIRRFSLRFTCSDCTHFMGPETGCAHNWPNAEHVRVPDDQERGKELVFCKEFDLG